MFSITFCTLAPVYCTRKIAKDAFKIVLYVLQLFTCSIALYPGAVARLVLQQEFVCS